MVLQKLTEVQFNLVIGLKPRSVVLRIKENCCENNCTHSRDDKESVSCLHFWHNIWLVRLSLRLGKRPFTRTIRDIYESINTIWDVPKNQNRATPRYNNTMEILHHVIIDKLIVSCVSVLFCFSVGIHPETQIFPSPAQELCFQTIVLFEEAWRQRAYAIVTQASSLFDPYRSQLWFDQEKCQK